MSMCLTVNMREG